MGSCWLINQMVSNVSQQAQAETWRFSTLNFRDVLPAVWVIYKAYWRLSVCAAHAGATRRFAQQVRPVLVNPFCGLPTMGINSQWAIAKLRNAEKQMENGLITNRFSEALCRLSVQIIRNAIWWVHFLFTSAVLVNAVNVCCGRNGLWVRQSRVLT